jgi:hypothetical protein
MSYALRSKPVADPNILKHLSIDRQVEYQEEKEKAEKERSPALDYQSMLMEMKKKKLPDIAHENQPPPSFDEKKKLRENMFNFFEESTIEETRLVSCQFMRYSTDLLLQFSL